MAPSRRPEWPVLNRDAPIAQGLFCHVDERTGLDILNNTVYQNVVGSSTLVYGSPMNGLVRSNPGSGDGRIEIALTGSSAVRSYAFWVNRAGAGESSVGWVLGRTDTNEVFRWSNTTNTYRYVRNWSGGAVNFDLTTPPGLNVWSLVVIVADMTSTSGGVTWYIDGLPAAAVPPALSGTVNVSTTTFTYGNITTGTRDWNGFLGPCVIWNRLLTAGEAWTLYDPATRWDLYWTPSPRVRVM